MEILLPDLSNLHIQAQEILEFTGGNFTKNIYDQIIKIENSHVKLKFEANGSFEMLQNLKIGEIYTIIPKTYFALMAKDQIIINDFFQEIQIKQQNKTFLLSEKSPKLEHCRLEKNTIYCNGIFTVIFRRSLKMILLQHINNNGINNLHFEEVK